MRVFIIGGTGFLGTHLVHRLLKQGHEVTILTRCREKASELESLGTRVVVGDLLQPESFVSTLTPQDAVIFVAMPDVRPGRISLKRLKILQNDITCFSRPLSLPPRN